MGSKKPSRQQVIQYGMLIAEHPDFYDLIKKYTPAQVDSAQAHVESLSQRAQQSIDSLASTADLTRKPEKNNTGRICTARTPRVTGDPAHRNHTYRGGSRDMSGPGTDKLR